jgi:uncharacterized protein YciI
VKYLLDCLGELPMSSNHRKAHLSELQALSDQFEAAGPASNGEFNKQNETVADVEQSSQQDAQSNGMA